MNLSKPLPLRDVTTKPIRHESGAVLIELALCLPILVLVFLGSTEYIRALQAQQTLAVVSREAANATFRECVELDEVDDCLDHVYNQISNSAERALPGMELIISIYTYKYDKLTKSEVISQRGIIPSGGATGSGQHSRFSLADFQGAKRDFLKTEQKIAVAETFFHFSPLVQNISLGTSFYDAAIY